jgi:hypothetical protein
LLTTHYIRLLAPRSVLSAPHPQVFHAFHRTGPRDLPFAL